MPVKIVLQGLVTVLNIRVFIETVQAMEQSFFERGVPTAESLYIIQATGFQSVFERCKVFRLSPNPHMPQEEQLNRETVGFTRFHQMSFIEQPPDKLRGKLTIIFPVILAFCRIIGCELFDVLCRQPRIECTYFFACNSDFLSSELVFIRLFIGYFFFRKGFECVTFRYDERFFSKLCQRFEGMDTATGEEHVVSDTFIASQQPDFTSSESLVYFHTIRQLA